MLHCQMPMSPVMLCTFAQMLNCTFYKIIYYKFCSADADTLLLHSCRLIALEGSPWRTWSFITLRNHSEELPSDARDVQWEIPVPSLPYGFKLFPPGNFLYRSSWETPEIWEFANFLEFPVLQESPEFPPRGNFPFCKCPCIRFSIGFLD